MGIREILIKRVWLIFTIILSLFTGVVIGYSLKSELPFSNFFTNGLTLVWFINIIYIVFREARQNEKERNQERIRQEEFLIKELEKWVDKTTFTKIVYQNGNIFSIEHKDPTSLYYYDELINVLKSYNIYTHWENGKRDSENLKNKGIKAFNTFQSIIKKNLEKISLQITFETDKISDNFWSFPLTCDTILMKLRGDSRPLIIQKYNLFFGTVTIAQGESDKLTTLKKNIKELVENKDIIEQIKDYDNFKERLDSYESFTEFKTKCDKLIKDWERFHEFKPQN